MKFLTLSIFTVFVPGPSFAESSSNVNKKDFGRHHKKDTHFDFLMFTQLWPITSCLEWEDSGKSHACTIDDGKNQWTIHGVWPTRNNEIGPLFCNSSVPFNITKIEKLLPELNDKWTDVRVSKDEYGFWEHEWSKHGTCAMQLESMSDEYKYFEKALELHQKYNVTKYLSDYNVLPGSSYSPNVIVKALERSLKQNVAINCARDKNFSDKLFYEVIICFDKEFNVIGCENTKGGIFGSCKHGVIDQIDYPDTIHTRWWHCNLIWILFPIGVVLLGCLGCLFHYLYFGQRRREYTPIANSYEEI